VAVALIAVGVLILMQSGLIGGATATATPTAVAAKPTAPPATQAAQAPTTTPQSTAAPKPVAVLTATAMPTSPPATAAPQPTTPSTAAPAATPDATARVAAAQAAVASGDFPKAIQELEAVRQDPAINGDPSIVTVVDQTLVGTHNAYGNQLLDQGKLDDAYGQFGEALKIAPNDSVATDGQKRVVLTKNYGIMEANWGKDDEAAINALEQNMQLDPDFRDTRSKLYALLVAKADRLLGAGDRNGAFPVLTRALQVVPDGPEAKTRLASYTPTPVPQPTPVPYVPPAPRPQPQPQPQPAPQPQPERPFRPPGAPV
jgi:hypothetical protein